MKRILLIVAAATLLFTSCEKKQCQNQLYFAGSQFGGTGATIIIGNNIKTVRVNESIKIPYQQKVEIGNLHFYTNDCGRIYTLTQDATGEYKVF